MKIYLLAGAMFRIYISYSLNVYIALWMGEFKIEDLLDVGILKVLSKINFLAVCELMSVSLKFNSTISYGVCSKFSFC